MALKIVIIGAGVAGLSIGWRLLQAGARVTILDRGQPARGATWAAAGMLALTAELQDAQAAERALAEQANALWPDFAAEIELASGQSIDLKRSGTLMLASDAPALDTMRARGGEILDPEAARALAPLLTGEFAGALWAAHEAHLDSRALGLALTTVFVKAGGVVVSHTPAVQIEQRGGRAIAVLTPYDRHDGDAIVVAAGAWSGLLDDIAIVPVKGEMIALRPAAADAAFLQAPVIWGNGIYTVPRGQHLLVGATVQEAGFDTSTSAAVRDDLRGRAQHLMPALRHWTLSGHWAGLRPASPDGLPLLGPGFAENLFVASGQFRNGILFAPAIARMMADLVLGRGSALAAFDPRRFKT